MQHGSDTALLQHRRFYILYLAARDKLIGKALSAFCASSLEHLSAVSSCHSLSEAVLLLSLSFLGLVCSEHLMHLLNILSCSVPPGIRQRHESGDTFHNDAYIIPNSFPFVKCFFEF